MKLRKLKNGMQVYELEKPVKLEIYTKCPLKWELTDKETGEVYIGQNPTTEGSNGMSWSKKKDA